MIPFRRVIWLLVLSIIIVGCESQPTERTTSKQVSATSTSKATSGAVVALVDGQTVRWQQIRPLLIEAQGAGVLADLVLDRQIDKALAEKKLIVTESDINREKQRMLDRLDDDANTAIRLLQQLRSRRGLGPKRFAMLLKRNAGLGKLVADQVRITDAMVKQEYQRQYGAKTIARMILLPTVNQATLVAKRLAAGESFTELAVAMSRDVSAAQGGLLPPISSADATFPAAVRNTAAKLAQGQVSEPIALDDGFAILRCERKVPAQNVPIEKVADRLRKQVELRITSPLMQRLARVLLENADVTVLDAELNRRWTLYRSELVKPAD